MEVNFQANTQQLNIIFRDVVSKAIDLFVKKQLRPSDSTEIVDDPVDDAEDDENWNTVIEDTGDGPHDTELCQMCQFLQKPCVRRRRRNVN